MTWKVVYVDDGLGDASVFNTDSFSISFWVKEVPSDSWGAYINKQETWLIRKDCNDADEMRFDPRGGGDMTPQKIGDISDTWAHFTITHDSADPGLNTHWYMNGGEKVYAQELGATNNLAYYMTFGGTHNGNTTTPGFGELGKFKMDEVCFVDR